MRDLLLKCEFTAGVPGRIQPFYDILLDIIFYLAVCDGLVSKIGNDKYIFNSGTKSCHLGIMQLDVMFIENFCNLIQQSGPVLSDHFNYSLLALQCFREIDFSLNRELL